MLFYARLYSKLRNAWHRLAYLGISGDMSFFEQQKTHLLNVMMVPAVPLTLYYVFSNLTGRPGLALFNLTGLICYLTILILHYLHCLLWLRTYIILVILGTFFGEAICFDNGMEYNLLLSVVCCLILFNSSRSYFGMATLIVSSFLFIKYYQYRHYHPDQSITIKAMMNILSCMVLFVLAMHYFRKVYLRYHFQVEENKVLLEAQQQQLLHRKRELKIKNKQLISLSDSRQQIMYTLVHDLRNPLSGIEALSARLMQRESLDADVKKLIAVIAATAERSQRQIQDLLETHQYAESALPGAKQLINLSELVEQTLIPLSYQAAEKSVQLSFRTNEGAVIARVNPMQYTRLVENLVSNAIKFSYHHQEITVMLRQEQNVVLLQVEDRGTGIPEEEMPHLFMRESGAGKAGTDGEKSFGRGLAICRSIAEAHGGSIQVARVLPEGSLFTVTIPSGNEV
jgi:signal transduction histidine kinase